jgi:hypothetical protein
MQALNYNIHDILRFRIVRDSSRGLRDLINLKFSFFEVEDVDNPDITLNVGRFTPSNDGCYLVDHKYHVKDDYFYCKDSEGGAGWEVEVMGFGDKPTTINLDSRLNGFRAFVYPDFIAQNFLLRVIEHKLGNRGYFLAHSAGVSKNRQAYMLAGRGGAFKTSLSIDFIRNAGFEFLGDDRVILHKDGVYSFPLGLNVFDFMCNHLPGEDSWGISDKIRFLGYLSGGGGNRVKVGEPSNLRNLFFIVRSNKKAVAKRPVSPEDAVDKLILNNRLEDFISLRCMGVNSGPHLRYALAYSYIFPGDRVVTQRKRLEGELADILQDIPVYEIEIPNTYNQAVFKEIHDFIKATEAGPL